MSSRCDGSADWTGPHSIIWPGPLGPSPILSQTVKFKQAAPSASPIGAGKKREGGHAGGAPMKGKWALFSIPAAELAPLVCLCVCLVGVILGATNSRTCSQPVVVGRRRRRSQDAADLRRRAARGAERARVSPSGGAVGAPRLLPERHLGPTTATRRRRTSWRRRRAKTAGALPLVEWRESSWWHSAAPGPSSCTRKFVKRSATSEGRR
jgi:hypothetical protein